MRSHFAVVTATTLLALFACQPGASDKPAGPRSPLKSELKKWNNKQCVADTTCFLMSVSYPELTGGDSLIRAVIRLDIQDTYRSMIDFEGHYAALPFEQMLDSVFTAMGKSFTDFRTAFPESAITEWTVNANGNVPVLNNRIITVEVSTDSYLGGAHPNYGTSIVSYNLADGKPLEMADLLADTSAVLPMLQKAYEADKGGAVADLLFPEFNGKLPLTQNVAVMPQGIRFYYNSYEVAPYAVGPADLLLTWEQLGDLADRKKLLE
ncbi:MAG: DUF4163 domain-containing protein [Saprospiraceae bacterium]|nr:DUF4163 domain-containing protein [Saprospiraceae bacterium]